MFNKMNIHSIIQFTNLINRENFINVMNFKLAIMLGMEKFLQGLALQYDGELKYKLADARNK